MNFFSIKISNEEFLDTVEEIKNGGQNILINKLSKLRNQIDSDSLFFIQLGGDDVPWKKGFIGVAKTVELPSDDPDNDGYFRIRIQMRLTLPEVIKREEFRFYYETYDAGGVGPATKGDGNEALKAIEDKKACALFRVIAEMHPELEPEIREILSVDLNNIVFGPMMRGYEQEVTYEEAIEISKRKYENYINEDTKAEYKKYIEANLKNRKKIFCNWLKKQYIPDGIHNNGNHYSDDVIKRYATALENKASELDGFFCRSTNMYTYTDLIEFLCVKEKAFECKNFRIINKKTLSGGFSCALDRYSEFLLSIYYGDQSAVKKYKTCLEISLSNRKRTLHPLNTILYGAPGTGKTYSTINYAVAIANNEEVDFSMNDDASRNALVDKYNKLVKQGQIVFTTFHQNYGYEEFIQGLRPDTESKTMSFKTVDGVFKCLADKALNYPEKDFVIIIDEINRANISKVFGELITLIEEDKRWGEKHKMSVTLQSGDVFAVPNNLYIVGTMNSADKSISLIDAALRRRFEFIEIRPDENLIIDTDLRNIYVRLNDYLLKKLKSPDLLIGHSYFMNKDLSKLPDTMNKNVIPLLYEYFFDQKENVKNALEHALVGFEGRFDVSDARFGRLRVNNKPV